MSNDTDRTPEDDLVYEHLVELVKLIERTGRKVTGLRIEFERSPQQRFVLKPVDDQASMTDDFSNLIQDDEALH